MIEISILLMSGIYIYLLSKIKLSSSLITISSSLSAIWLAILLYSGSFLEIDIVSMGILIEASLEEVYKLAIPLIIYLIIRKKYIDEHLLLKLYFISFLTFVIFENILYFSTFVVYENPLWSIIYRCIIPVLLHIAGLYALYYYRFIFNYSLFKSISLTLVTGISIHFIWNYIISEVPDYLFLLVFLLILFWVSFSINFWKILSQVRFHTLVISWLSSIILITSFNPVNYEITKDRVNYYSAIKTYSDFKEIKEISRNMYMSNISEENLLDLKLHSFLTNKQINNNIFSWKFESNLENLKKKIESKKK